MRPSPPSVAVPALLLILLVSPLVAQSDGELDSNFGSFGGFAVWNWSHEVQLATAVATDDLLFGVGTYTDGTGLDNLHFQGVDRSGEIRGDRSCRNSTAAFGPIATGSGALAATLDASGQLVVGGWATFVGSTDKVPLVARYDISQSGCTLDTAFSTTGFEVLDDFDFCAGESCSIIALVPRPGVIAAQARTIALLQATSTSFTVRYFLLAFNFTGDIDTNFGASGIREVTAPGLGALVSGAALAVDDERRILVLVTRIENGSSLDLDTKLLRFDAAGDLDTGYYFGGVRSILDSGVDDDDQEAAGDLLVLPGGERLWASGRLNGSDSWIGMFDAGPDTQSLFGVTTPRLAYQGNQRIVYSLGRSVADEFMIRRVTSDTFETDHTYGESHGEVFYDIDFGGGTAQEVVDFLLWAGRPIVVGNAFNSSNVSSGFLMRARNGYIFADGFEGSSVELWNGY